MTVDENTNNRKDGLSLQLFMRRRKRQSLFVSNKFCSSLSVRHHALGIFILVSLCSYGAIMVDGFPLSLYHVNSNKGAIRRYSSSRIRATIHDTTDDGISVPDNEVVYPLHHDQDDDGTLQKETKVPRHIAFICDGNSRWARNQNLPQVIGHSRGADNLLTLLRHLKDQYSPGVEYVTFYGFSTENWSRDSTEINGIWNIMDQTARKFQDIAVNEGVRVKILGDWQDDKISPALRNTLATLEKVTAVSSQKLKTNLTVCIAINYGGRSDILKAALQMANNHHQNHLSHNKEYNDGEENNQELMEDIFDQYLCTDGIPDPDLLIRTGGQQRLSNFLLWNVAYSELYFSKYMWPDFNEEQLDEAIEWFQGTQRTYGGR